MTMEQLVADVQAQLRAGAESLASLLHTYNRWNQQLKYSVTARSTMPTTLFLQPKHTFGFAPRTTMDPIAMQDLCEKLMLFWKIINICCLTTDNLLSHFWILNTCC
jgi:hypothetical protein